MPKALGRSYLPPQISKRGGIAGEFTVTRVSVEEFWIVGSGMLSAILNSSSSALTCPQAPHLKCHTDAMCDFYVAGPQSPELLQTLINTSLATADFPFMRSKMSTLTGVELPPLRV
jgi:dimethylglycine dehydrogenase